VGAALRARYLGSVGCSDFANFTRLGEGWGWMHNDKINLVTVKKRVLLFLPFLVAFFLKNV
jgi:hypothetical protein